MGTATLIIGDSGTGKSTSLRRLNPDDCILVQVDRKRLPFPSAHWKNWDKNLKKGTLISTDKWEVIKVIIANAYHYGKRIVIIDDFQYVMSNEFMRRSEERTFDKFTEIARHAWEIIKSAQEAHDDLRVYFLAHTEETPSGRTKMKTIGKMLDEKITVEGMFTIVLKTVVRDGQYLFTTQNSGTDTVKSPIGLFDTHEINNDLLDIDTTICHYYGIETHTTTEQIA